MREKEKAFSNIVKTYKNTVFTVCSLMSIFSGYYTFNVSDSDVQADRIAMESDFATAGQDMYAAFLGL